MSASRIKTNIIGTSNVTLLCMKLDIKLVYISTDFVYPSSEEPLEEWRNLNPQNEYAWSKLGGECAVRQYDKSLIIRTTFTERPYPLYSTSNAYRNLMYIDIYINF